MLRKHTLFAIVLVVTCCACQFAIRDLEETIAGPTIVVPDGVTITFPKPLRNEYSWTEIFLEPREAGILCSPLGDAVRRAQCILGESGLEAILIQPNGREIPLSLSYANQYITASAPPLMLRESQPQEFSALRLRSVHPLALARIVWLTYDPRDTKGGTSLPSNATP